MEDRRKRKTKLAIRNAFLELLKYKSIHQITVVEISRIADLGRGTFYLHYKDIYDLMINIENEIIYKINELYDLSFDNENNGSILSFSEKVTDYMYVNKDIFLVISREKGNIGMLEKIKTFFYDKLLSNNLRDVNKLEEAETIFIVSGVFGILEKWLRDEMVMPKEIISNMINHVLRKFEA